MKYFAVAMICLLSIGCATPMIHTTMGLSDRYPVQSPENVIILERNKPVNQNYQIIGHVLVEGKYGVSEGDAYTQAKQTASQMGANGIIDFHTGPGCERRYDGGMHYSGIAVKWLKAGESAKPLDQPFVIYRLPIRDPENPGKFFAPENETWENYPLMDFQWVNKAVFKGYHIMPTSEVKYPVSIDEVKTMPHEQMMGIGGNESQLLLDVSFRSKSDTNIAEIVALAFADLNVSIFNKQTGDISSPKNIHGYGGGLGILHNLFTNQLEEAVGEALLKVAEELPDIRVRPQI